MSNTRELIEFYPYDQAKPLWAAQCVTDHNILRSCLYDHVAAYLVPMPFLYPI